MKTVSSPSPTSGFRSALPALSLSMLLASLGTSIANIALPSLAQAFEAPFHHVQWVVVSYLAALTLVTVLAGWLGDVFGRRRMLLAGLLLFSLASVLCGLVPDQGAPAMGAPGLWMLVAARAVQGAGAAFLMTLTIALVRETAGNDRIGRAMGLLGTMSAVGTALGPSLGGFLIAALGWRAIFFVLVPLGLVAMGLVLRLPAAGEQQAQAPVFSLSLSQVFMSQGRGLAPNLIGNLFVATVMMTTLIVGPFYLALALGLPEAMVGLVMSVGPLISIASGVPAGRLVDRWGARRVLAIGLAALAAGAFALAVLPDLFGVGGYVTAIAVLTPGYQLFQAANNTAVMAAVPADRRGTVSGLLSLSRNLGLIAGASVMGGLFSFAVGTDSIEHAAPGAIAGGMRLVFLVAGASMVAAFAILRGTLLRPARADV